MLDNAGNRMYRVLLDHFGQLQIQLLTIPERNIQYSYFCHKLSFFLVIKGASANIKD